VGILRSNLRFAASDTRVLGASRQSNTQSKAGQSDCRDYAEGAKDRFRSRRWFFRRISCVKIVGFHFGWWIRIVARLTYRSNILGPKISVKLYVGQNLRHLDTRLIRIGPRHAQRSSYEKTEFVVH